MNPLHCAIRLCYTRPQVSAMVRSRPGQAECAKCGNACHAKPGQHSARVDVYAQEEAGREGVEQRRSAWHAWLRLVGPVGFHFDFERWWAEFQ